MRVRVDTGDDLAVYVGYLILHPLQFDDPLRDLGDTDPVAASATRGRLMDELVDRGGLALTTLVGGPGGGRVERGDDGNGYRVAAAHDEP